MFFRPIFHQRWPSWPLFCSHIFTIDEWYYYSPLWPELFHQHCVLYMCISAFTFFSKEKEPYWQGRPIWTERSTWTVPGAFLWCQWSKAPQRDHFVCCLCPSVCLSVSLSCFVLLAPLAFQGILVWQNFDKTIGMCTFKWRLSSMLYKQFYFTQITGSTWSSCTVLIYTFPTRLVLPRDNCLVCFMCFVVTYSH